MSYTAIYKSKKTTADKAVGAIGNGSTLVVAMAVGAPPAILKAIANRVKADDLTDLTVYYKISTKHMGESLLAADVLPKIHAKTFFITGIERAIIQKQQHSEKLVSFVPCHFSQIPRVMRENIRANTFVVTVSPMDTGGYFSLGTNNDFASTAARYCDRLIIEVNPNMPRVFGQSQIHVSEVDAIVENDCPLIEFPSVEPGEIDLKVASFVAPLVPDRATIQLGIGKLPGAVAKLLEHHKDLGIHSELFSPAMADLIEKGVITGRYKTLNPYKHVYTVALGDKRMYDFMNNNASMESYSVEYVNGVGTIAQQENIVSVNTAIQIDLYGQVNSEFIGAHEYSGSGGQFDFVKGAAAAKGGKSIIALHSTAKNGAISTIVPKVDMVTDVRMDVEYVATEQGIVNLRGKTTKERALALISIAHPQFHDELIAKAKEVTLI